MSSPINYDIISYNSFMEVIHFIESHLPELIEDHRIIYKYNISVLKKFRAMSDKMLAECRSFETLINVYSAYLKYYTPSNEIVQSFSQLCKTFANSYYSSYLTYQREMQRLSKYKKFIQDIESKPKPKQHWYSFFSSETILPKEISEDECLKEDCADLDINISTLIRQFTQLLIPKLK